MMTTGIHMGAANSKNEKASISVIGAYSRNRTKINARPADLSLGNNETMQRTETSESTVIWSITPVYHGKESKWQK